MVVCTLLFIFSVWLPISASAQTGDQTPNGVISGGIGPGLDDAQQRARYEKAAAAGNAQAMRELGKLYRDGRGVPRDYDVARQWYEKAAAAGDSLAMCELGYFYKSARGVPRDYDVARQWYEKAAAAGNAQAVYELGVFYENGLGVPQDYDQARQRFEKAAAAKFSLAMLELGNLYKNGRGVPQDDEQARQWYEKAAASDSRVFHVGPSVTAPVPFYHPEPKYSDEAFRKHLQGVVVLHLVVDASGHTRNIALVRGQGMGLDENAIAVVKTWIYKPGIKDGQPVSVDMNIEVPFELKNQGQTERPQGK